MLPCASVVNGTVAYNLQTESYSVYFLKSLSSSRTYVGYTKEPNRRLKQHNGILKLKKPTKRTFKNRPWQYVCIVTGFRNAHEALQFEKGWHVARSPMIRIRDFGKKRRYKKGLHILSCEEGLSYMFANRWTRTSPDPFSYPLTLIWNRPEDSCFSFTWLSNNPTQFKDWNVYQGHANLNDIPKCIEDQIKFNHLCTTLKFNT